MSTIQIEVAPPKDDHELQRLTDITFQSFNGFGAGIERTQYWFAQVGREHLRVARVNGEVVGGLGLLEFGQYFCGRSVPSVGVTAVAIAPESRGQHIGLELMRAVVREQADRGTALSVLYPATYPIYRGAGYEAAGVRAHYRFELKHLGIRDHTCRIRPMNDDDRDAVYAIHAERGKHSAGVIDRQRRQWDRIFNTKWTPAYAYVVQAPSGNERNFGGLQGFLVYEQNGGPHGGFEIRVRDMAALTAAAGRRILTMLVEHGSMAINVYIDGSLADPILHLAREGYAKIEDRIFWMLRICHVEAALAGRGYARGLQTEVHLQVEDDVVSSNAERFVLRVADGRAHVERGGEGRIKLHARALAACYSGFLSPGELRSCGEVTGPDEDIAALCAIFAGPAPWISDRF